MTAGNWTELADERLLERRISGLELSIEGPDYYPWQEGLYLRSPYEVVDGKVTIPSEPGWGVELNPVWHARSRHQESERA